MATSYTLSEWIGTNGGPLIVMPHSLLPEWYGTDVAPTPREALFRWDGPDSPATDYDRACDAANDYLAPLPVAGATALVLGQEHDGCKVLRRGADVFVAQLFEEQEIYLEQALSHVYANAPNFVVELYRSPIPEHVIFDSAYPGGDKEEALSFELPAPVYAVHTYLCDGGADYHPLPLILHRFVPIAV